MNKLVYILSFLAVVFSCDTIDESDRYVDKEETGPVTPTQYVKNVLLEDFTGQQCVNCPAAAEEAKRLQELYAGKVIVVGIHAGSQSTSVFQTEAGNAYRGIFYPEGDGAQGGYPAGMIDRTSFDGSIVSKTVSKWAGHVKNRIEIEARLGLSLACNYDEANNSIVVTSTLSAASAMSNMKLQLWVIENGIKAYQIGQKDYVHNHVLRGAVNGTWGQDVETKNGDMQYTSDVYELDSKWKPENMQIVGFVYDASTKEILQSSETELIGTAPAKYVKNVLLEDFTGQQCVNCPAAAEEAKRLQEFHEGKLVVVGIHAGNQSTPVFQTEAGNAYREIFYPEGNGAQGGYPAGMIDRASFDGSVVSKTVSKWGGLVKSHIEMEAKLGLSLACNYDEANNSIVVTSILSAASAISNIKLQLWVIESGIAAYQVGQKDYIHNHVLRGAINGTWGEIVTTKENGMMQYTSSPYALNSKWKSENMQVVGFVYDDITKEVLQVAEVKLKK